MYKYLFYIIVITHLSYCSTAQNVSKFNDREKEYLLIFEGFKNYMTNKLLDNSDISDTSEMKFMLLNFIVSDYKLDSTDKLHFKKNEVPNESLLNFEKEIQLLYQFFYERRNLNLIQHLTAIPIRFSSDKCMYEKLTPFQRENTFVYYDNRNSNIPLGYMLFVPKFKKSITESRIWSWTLIFNNGLWAFRSPMGEIGIEHFVSQGIKGPKHPIGN